MELYVTFPSLCNSNATVRGTHHKLDQGYQGCLQGTKRAYSFSLATGKVGTNAVILPSGFQIFMTENIIS